MRCSLDKVLLDARQLATRIRATDETADMLIKQASDAHNKVIAKKQCQEETMSFEELHQISKSRPRNRLMMCIAAENKQLELLQQENKILRTSLTEYETTFDMIMKKFRKHKNILKKLDQIENGDLNHTIPQINNDFSSSSLIGNNEKILSLCSRITKLQKAIEDALKVDNKVTDDLNEIETKLFYENQELRRLIEINEEFKNEILLNDCLELRSQNALKMDFIDENRLDLSRGHDLYSLSLSSSIVTNGISLKENKILPSKLKFPRSIINNHHSISSKSDIVNGSSEDNINEETNDDNNENDDDDHSSIASDASVKTLI